MNRIENEFEHWDQTAEWPTKACGRQGFTGSGRAKTNKFKNEYVKAIDAHHLTPTPGSCTCRRRPRAFSGEVGFAVCALFSPFFGRAKKGKAYGLPFAYGIYADSLAGMEFIGGVQLGQTPAGNGWVGLSPANSGYAVWSHPNNVQLTYYRYNNEQLFPSMLSTNAVAINPQVDAIPFFIPNTTIPNPNATCFDNQSVVFLRNAPSTNITKHVEGSIDKEINRKGGESSCNLYPNPVDNYFNIDVDEEINVSISKDQVKIFDNLGKQQDFDFEKTKSGFKIDVSNLNTGFYFIVAHSNTGFICQQKFSIKR